MGRKIHTLSGHVIEEEDRDPSKVYLLDGTAIDRDADD